MFCSESRELSTYSKHCMMDTIEVYACYTVKIYKYKSLTNFKQGGAHPTRRCWIRLCKRNVENIRDRHHSVTLDRFRKLRDEGRGLPSGTDTTESTEDCRMQCIYDFNYENYFI